MSEEGMRVMKASIDRGEETTRVRATIGGFDKMDQAKKFIEDLDAFVKEWAEEHNPQTRLT